MGSLYAWLVSWTVRLLAGRPRPNKGRVNSILLTRLDEMGDFVLFSAMLRPLRQAFPHAHIALVVSDWVRPLAELCPYIDEVVAFPTAGPKWRQYICGPVRALRVARRLGRHFDVAINPRYDRDIRGAAFLAAFSRASRIGGYPSSTEPFKKAVNCGYDRLYTHLLPVTDAVVHDVERSRPILEFLEIYGARLTPEVWLSQEDHREAARLLTREGWSPGDPLICLGIGAALPRRRWPFVSFLQLAQRLTSISRVRFLLVGSAGDRADAEHLRDSLGSQIINLCGFASLRVSTAAIAGCDLYIGNDSGPMHLAAAAGKPVVEISCHSEQGDPKHFQSPQRFGPVTESRIILSPPSAQAPCTASCLADEAHCITQVTVEQVYQAAMTLLEASYDIAVPMLTMDDRRTR